jgi:hypothetical protein
MPRMLIPILRKDLREITSNWRIWMPMVVVPLFLVVIVPSLIFHSLATQGAKQAKGLEPFMQLLATRYDFTSFFSFPW